MGLFSSKREQEIRRETRIRQAKGKINQYLNKSRQIERHYWDLGKRALSLGDRERFKQLGTAMIQARDSRNQWERYLLELETLSIRREEVSATSAFLDSINAVAASVLAGAKPEEVEAARTKLTESLARAESVSLSLNSTMDQGLDAMLSTEYIDEDRLDNMMRSMRSSGQVDHDLTGPDGGLDAALERIESTMKSELNPSTP